VSQSFHRRHHRDPTPKQWEAFTLERYGGDTNPDEYVKIFVTQVGLYSTKDAIMCKAFLTTLKGLALEWFISLPP